MKYKRGIAEQIGYSINFAILLLLGFLTLYPFWHVLMYSISDSRASITGGLFFIPRDPTLLSYRMLLQTKQILVAYRNTILRTVIGTVLSIGITALTAFPLSLRRLRGRGFFSLMIYFTMLFSGGMIPTYLIVLNLGLIDTFWALIIPGMLSAYNMFIMRNYFQALPPSLEESAYMDGANPPMVLLFIVLPISTPCIAAIAMFYGVANWNAFMDGILYTNSNQLQLLSVYLRNLLSGTGAFDALGPLMGAETRVLTEETVRMTAIAVSVIPVLLVYPFLQRFYTKGIMIGAVKG